MKPTNGFEVWLSGRVVKMGRGSKNVTPLEAMAFGFGARAARDWIHDNDCAEEIRLSLGAESVLQAKNKTIAELRKALNGVVLTGMAMDKHFDARKVLAKAKGDG